MRIELATAALLMVGAAAASALSLGDAMPARDVEMKNVDGRELTLAGEAGPKGTLVIFACNHCPWVQAWEPRLATIGNEYRRKGIGVIMVNPNDPAAYPEDAFAPMQERARARGYEFPYVVDATSNVARAFGATHTPEAFLFDARGALVYHGTVDDNARHPEAVKRQYLREALDALLSGRAIEPAETKSLGCSIKFRS